MTTESDAALADLAAELYAGSLSDFTAARNARAKDTGDRDLASQIRALKKPSIAAWVVNVFSRERAGELGEVLELAAELREAQGDLDAAALAKLGRERRALTNRLAERAAELGRARGEKITAGTLEAVRQTIAAAFFDEDAATAVASGRLIRELEPSDTYPLELIVGGGLPEAPAPAPQPVDEVRERRERRQAERTLREAEKELAAAEKDRARADRELRDASSRSEQLAARIEQLETELALARKDAEKAGSEVTAAEKAQAAVDERVSAAERAVADAQSVLDEL